MHDAGWPSTEVVERLRRFVELTGEEHALVAGEPLPELAEHVGELATADAGQVTELSFGRGSFDLTVCVGTLHRVRRPELAVAELARVTRIGGRVLVADRLAPTDPLQGIELDRLERERDPEHGRFLPDADVRQFFEANGLVLLRSDTQTETGWYLFRK